MNNVYNNDLGFSKWGRSRLSIPNTVYPSIHPVDMPVDAGGAEGLLSVKCSAVKSPILSKQRSSREIFGQKEVWR